MKEVLLIAMHQHNLNAGKNVKSGLRSLYLEQYFKADKNKKHSGKHWYGFENFFINKLPEFWSKIYFDKINYHDYWKTTAVKYDGLTDGKALVGNNQNNRTKPEGYYWGIKYVDGHAVKKEPGIVYIIIDCKFPVVLFKDII